MINIQEILLSKSNDEFRINRYIKFINDCQQINIKTDNIILEKHHICPLAKDMFPEYKSFKEHPWNKALLTPRQHYIAHIMLWKIFGKSQTRALWFMRHSKPKSQVHYNKMSSKMFDNLRKQDLERQKILQCGDKHWSKQPGKTHNAITNHPRGMLGKSHTQEYKDFMSKNQLGNKNHFYGKNHKDSTKIKISEKLSGRKWATNGVNDKLICPNTPLEIGWKYGRSNGGRNI